MSAGIKIGEYRMVMEPPLVNGKRGSVAFSTVVENDGEFLMFYTNISGPFEASKKEARRYPVSPFVRGSGRSYIWKYQIGLATSKDGVSFKFEKDPIMGPDGLPSTPVVIPHEDRFYMLFSHVPEGKYERRVGIAVSKDPEGPWKFIRDVIFPEKWWEAGAIDLGPGFVRVSKDEYLIYYSSIWRETSPRVILSYKFPIIKDLKFLKKRLFLRRIGVAVVKIGEQVRAVKLESKTKELNGKIGSWRESVFCPSFWSGPCGNILLFASSNYSRGFPYDQYIGGVRVEGPYVRAFQEDPWILISGPSISEGTALDSPLIVYANGRYRLYFSMMNRKEGIWRTYVSDVSGC